MNPTTLTAWLICLVLAFFAATVAMLNRYELMGLRRQLEGPAAVLPQGEVPAQEGLQELREELEKIDRRLLRMIQENQGAGSPEGVPEEGTAAAPESEGQ